MKGIARYLGVGLGVSLALVVLVIASFFAYRAADSFLHRRAGEAAPNLVQDGRTFRDLNKNGQLDIYEDSRRGVDERVDDILAQMTLEEKAGMMFITIINVGPDGELQELPNPSSLFTLFLPANSDYVTGKLMNHFNIIFAPKARELAMWQNELQKLAERTRLGIPVTLASDPRHAFGLNPAASMPAVDFSLWPEPLGLAAIRDPGIVQGFADIARQEYLAVGIRLALHPMADLATEPRWARVAGTFGEDAELSAQTVYAYIRGFQGAELGPESVATMVKHFSGGGPQRDGEDPHFSYGKEQVYPGDNFDYHLIPFEQGAFAAGAAQIMPYYGIPVGQTAEDVGFAFNREIITGQLREKYGFDGVICSDWGIINDTKLFGMLPFMEARAWGVEALSPAQRMRKSLEAGIDQFGGEADPDLIIELVQSGQVAESRIDESVRRLLRDKFRLGLFDDPYVDPEQAGKVVGAESFLQAGVEAQRKSLVLLKNGAPAGADGVSATVLPLQGRPKIYIENIDPAVADRYGQVVQESSEADFAIIRIAAPYQPREGVFESFMHAGDLDFKGEERQRLLALLDQVPTIVDIYLDRAAVFPGIAEKSAALLANFGATDEVVLDAVFGKYSPTGKLPFEMPSSMDAVRAQKEDLPYDSLNPVFRFGHGLSYGDLPREAPAQLTGGM